MKNLKKAPLIGFKDSDRDMLMPDCMLLSLAAMDIVQAAIQPEIGKYELGIHGEELSDKEGILNEIIQRLGKEHGTFNSYQFYSPINELLNNT